MKTSIHLIKDFLNEFPIIIRRFPQTDEKFGLLFSQIDRITGCDDQPGMVSICRFFCKRIFYTAGNCQKLFNRKSIKSRKLCEHINIGITMSGFVIGVRLMCDIKFISELLLRVMMFLSELEQIFRKLNICQRRTSLHKIDSNVNRLYQDFSYRN